MSLLSHLNSSLHNKYKNRPKHWKWNDTLYNKSFYWHQFEHSNISHRHTHLRSVISSRLRWNTIIQQSCSGFHYMIQLQKQNLSINKVIQMRWFCWYSFSSDCPQLELCGSAGTESLKAAAWRLDFTNLGRFFLPNYLKEKRCRSSQNPSFIIGFTLLLNRTFLSFWK